MKICPSCKAPNAADAKFCGFCNSMTPLPPSVAKTCPAGRHIMEPDWSECVYCRSDIAMPGPPPVPAGGSGNVRRPTVVESATQPAPGPGPHGTQPYFPDDKPLPPRMAPKPFKPVAVPPPAPLRPNLPLQNPSAAARKTVYRQEAFPGAVPNQAPPALAQRRIVGILVTYSWKPDGEIFPVREGRNLIGRDPDCEICIPADQTMSARNSHISFRTSFVIGDLVSMKGTDLNGFPIEQQFLSLPNYSVIRAGSTQFTFLAIQPAAAPAWDSIAGLDNS